MANIKITSDKAKYIEGNYQNTPYDVLAKEVGVTEQSMRAWCRKRGFIRTEEIDTIRDLLRQSNAQTSLGQLQALLLRHGIRRTKEAIRHNLRKMSIDYRTRPKPISDEAKRFIEEHYQKIGSKTIAKMLNKNGQNATESQVSVYMRQKGLKPTKSLCNRELSEEERLANTEGIKKAWRREKFAIENGLPRTGYQRVLERVSVLNHKFTDEEVLRIRAMSYEEQKQFAKDVGMTIRSINNIAKGRTYRNVTDEKHINMGKIFFF